MSLIVSRPSPNHDARPDGLLPDMLVLHYTGMQSAEEALARLCDPAAKVSSHYTIDRDGTLYEHVPEDRRAWHAGVSWWAGETDINSRSIGIELVNPGHEFGYIPFTDDQIDILIDLITGIRARYSIVPSRVLAHSDVAPARKDDPGELFPWKKLADSGIGLWPKASAILKEPYRVALARYGYDPNAPEDAIIRAFQRHFTPGKLNGVWDEDCASALVSLLAQS